MEEHKRRFNIKHFLLIILVLVIVIAIIVSINRFSFKKEYRAPTALSKELPSYRLIDLDNRIIYTDEDGDGTNDQKDILLGARKQLEDPASNIILEEEESNYYEGGDPPQHLANCADIIARAFKEAGFNLRDLVNEDIMINFDQYPLREIWNQKVTDPSIDYRRIQNLEVFFIRNSQILGIYFSASNEENLLSWFPGDIIFFDMDHDGFSDNVGIISDETTRDGIPKVIYNYIEPGYTVGKDILNEEIVTGHYRFPKPED